MSAHWFLVECADNDPIGKRGAPPLGDVVRVIVSPSLRVTLELRDQESVERDAAAKGYEMTFASAYSGVSRFHMEKLEDAVLKWLRERYSIANRLDVRIEPRVRIRVPSGIQ